jgi:CRISPR/Cas system-associated protein Csm6
VTTTHKHGSHRRLDLASLALVLIGVVFGALAYWLITVEHMNALVVVPSVVAITIGATNLIKREAPRR